MGTRRLGRQGEVMNQFAFEGLRTGHASFLRALIERGWRVAVFAAGLGALSTGAAIAQSMYWWQVWHPNVSTFNDYYYKNIIMPNGDQYFAGSYGHPVTGVPRVRFGLYPADLSQPPKLYFDEWAPAGAGRPFVNSMAVDSSGNMYLGGSTQGGAQGNWAVVKYRPDGTRRWSAFYNGSANGDDVVNSVVLDDFGNVFAIGFSKESATSYDAWIARYEPEPAGSAAVLLGAHRLFTSNWDFHMSGIAHPEGGAVGFGSWWFAAENRNVSEVIRIRPTSTPPYFDWPYAVAFWADPANHQTNWAWNGVVDSNGDYLAVSTIGANPTLPQFLTLGKFSGTMPATRPWPAIVIPVNSTEPYDFAYPPIALDSNDSVAIGGGYGGKSFVRKYDTNGILLWERFLQGDVPSSWNLVTDLQFDADGNLFVCAITWNTGREKDVLVARFDPLGNLVWSHTFNGPENANDVPYDISVNDDGIIGVVGYLTRAGKTQPLIMFAAEPTIAIADSYAVDEDSLLATTSVNGVLVNDKWKSNATVILESDVLHGALTLLNDGSFTYVPDPDFDQTDSFTYSVDRYGSRSQTVTVTITINAIADVFDHMIDAGTEIQDLIALYGGSAGDRLQDSLDHLGAALSLFYANLWEDSAFEIVEAIVDLELSVNAGLPPELAIPLMEVLCEASKMMALDRITDAIDQNGDPQKIAQAQRFVTQGDDKRAGGKYLQAAHKYKDAISHADDA